MTMCGRKHAVHTEKTHRQRIVCLVLAMLVSLLFAGCGENAISLDDARAIVDELRQEGYVPEDWVYIDRRYPAYFDCSRVYLAYIDRDMYASHQSYWLEGTDPESLYPGYEPEEPENVFHIVKIVLREDGTYGAAVYMRGTYYKYVDRMQANGHRQGTAYEACTRLELADADPAACFLIRKKLFGGYAVEDVCGRSSGGCTADAVSVKAKLHDKSLTENYYDINPRRTGKEIAAFMQQQGMIPADMRLVYTDGEKNIYIPSALYASHRSYWLEGTEEKDLCEGINHELSQNGDHVFWEIEVTGIICNAESKTAYGITFRPDTSYCRAVIYQDCLFYKTILHYDWDGFHRFTWRDVETVTGGDTFSGNTVGTYWCHYEEGKPVIEKAAEE